ncbi:MAG: PhzF family phenazine biosynthesis protein [Silicimonas sp.]|nr:PhzF family phenazine biosynthesis protein [Silicimonas sp.]
MTEYLVYDVFTDHAFGGNPLAVIPDATGLAEDRLLKIAREFNFSETTFVLPPKDPSHDARVRIFTPTRELAFAGHPTIGTALALHGLGRAGAEMVLELGVGPIPVRIEGGVAEFATRVPLATADAAGLPALAACLGLPETAIRTDRHAPIEASLGAEFTLIELTDTDALDAATPAIDAFRVAIPDAERLAILAYVRDGARIEARMFAPLGGILEDPATGSAIAALASWLGKLEGESREFEVSQGVKMGRPSQISASVTVENGVPVEVRIAGRATKVMEGRLTL